MSQVKLELPHDKVEEMKEMIRANISDAVYAHTIRLINSPVGQLASITLDEVNTRKKRLNHLILCRRILFLLMLGSIIFAYFSWSYRPLLLAIGLLLFWLIFISPRQSETNISIAARIEVFSAMLCDKRFLSRVEEVVGCELPFADMCSDYDGETPSNEGGN